MRGISVYCPRQTTAIVLDRVGFVSNTEECLGRHMSTNKDSSVPNV